MKKHIAISGNFGTHALITDGKNTQVEWVGENAGRWVIHFATRWKETSTSVYYKWWY
jgi:hypothetical protein